MSRRIFYAWLMIFTCTCASAQTDSLINILPGHPDDTSKTWLYRDISYYLLESHLPDSALHYSRKGYKLARSLDFGPGQIWNLNQIALAHEHNNRFDSSQWYLQKAVETARAFDDGVAMGNLISSIGVSYYFQGEFVKAIQYYDHSLRVFDSIRYHDGKARTLNNLAIIYRIRRNYNKAIEIYERSLQLKRALADTLGLATTHHNLGYCYSFLPNEKQSLFHFDRAIQLYTEIGENTERYYSQIGLGVALVNLGKTTEAYEKIASALDALPHNTDLEYLTGMVYLGALKVKEGELSEGISLMNSGYEILKASGRLELLKNIELELANGYEATGNFAQSSLHWKQYAQLTDSLASEQKQWAMEEMQTRYETREKENKISMQELEIERQAARRNFLVVGILFSLLLLVAAVIYAVNQRKMRRKLADANATIGKALEDNKNLIKEIHHRVKNNLQMVSSLLSIQSREISDTKARQVIKDSHTRVQSMGLIHQFLYRKDEFRSIDISAYVATLAAQLAKAHSPSQANISIDTEVDNIYLDVDTAIPIGLIINELVTNALKHAFPDNETGTIRISLQACKEKLVLKVSDNGKGMLPDQNEGTFGYKLLETFKEKLGAEMAIQSQRSGGTAVSYVLSNYKLYANE